MDSKPLTINALKKGPGRPLAKLRRQTPKSKTFDIKRTLMIDSPNPPLNESSCSSKAKSMAKIAYKSHQRTDRKAGNFHFVPPSGRKAQAEKRR